MRSGVFLLACWILLAPAVLAGAPETFVDAARTVAVDPSRGTDGRVDYPSLVRLGPWDDRNYALTLEDLELLPDNEAEIRAPIPAFFRVALRRARPALRHNEHVRYPLHALNVFRELAGGFLVDGRLYDRATRKGGRYYVDLSRPLRPESPASAGTGFLSGDVRVTFPEGASESAVAIDPADTSRLVAGSIGPNGSVRMHHSSDGGATWTQSELPLDPTCCDPSVAWSSDGRYAYATALSHCGLFRCDLYFYRSADGGLTWNDLESNTPGDPRRSVAQSADREYMHVDQYAGSPYRDRIYLTYHENNVLHFAYSSDFGNSWLGAIFSSAPENLGIAGDITTDRSGVIYFAWPAYESRTIRLSKSADGGASFGPISVVATTEAAYSYPLPSQEIRECQIYVSAAADLSDGPYADSIYLAWADTTAPSASDPAANHSRIRVAYSRDGGATWAVSTPHETADVLTVDRWQPFITVGSDGTVHAVYYDTRNSPDRTGVDVYYSFSTDGAQTWSAPRRVTEVTSPNIQDVFEFGDYDGLDIVMSDLIAIYTDNRDEVGGAIDSVDVYASGIAPGGTAGAGEVPGGDGLAGTPLTVTRNANGVDLDLAWGAACGDASDYAVYEGLLGDPASKSPVLCSTGGATSATITPSGGQRFYLAVAEFSGSEGSYGRTSSGNERAPDPGACLPQVRGACP